ncbi:MAG: prohibitin family protein [Clostridia bacterium]|jgi:regulator of protease activity HflC (stomatin/prohibitin superfamily)|nr:prohibitin family protein [Clostridia bacterium]
MLNKNFKNEKGNVVLGVIIGIVILIGTLVFASITTVPTGYVGVKTRFGQVQEETIQEGLNFKVPFIEGIVRIDCRTQKIEYDMEASSRDLQKISNIKIAVNYSVDKQEANILYREIGKDFKAVIIEPTIYEAMKSAIANYTAEELVTKRQEVSNLAQETLTNRLKDKGINITSLSMTDLSFSEEFDQAIEKKQVVEQQTQQAKYELEKAKVENEKRIENAKAEAEVMKQQNQEITDKTLELKRLEVQQKMIEKWNGELSKYMLGNSIPLFNLGEQNEK